MSCLSFIRNGPFHGSQAIFVDWQQLNLLFLFYSKSSCHFKRMRKLRQRSSKPRTSQLRSDTCKCESHRNVRVSICMLVLFKFMLYNLFFSGVKTLVKREEGSKYKATRRTNQQPLKKRKSRQDAKDDKRNVFLVNISMRKMTLEVEYSKE